MTHNEGEPNLNTMSFEELTAVRNFHFDRAFVFDASSDGPPMLVREEMQRVWDIQLEIAKRIPDKHPYKKFLLGFSELAREKG